MEPCCLQLERSLVEQLWEGYKHLTNLKVLDFTYSRKLITTPDFDGLPCLERIILKCCTHLKEIHPSIGCHERLIFLDMYFCKSLEMLPPIIRMKKLETLILTGCSELSKFPEIQTSMDNFVELSLKETGIETLPSSIGQYCTNLLYLDLRYCYNLNGIEGNFRLLKHLKGLYLEGCDQLTNLSTEGLFDAECCLHLLSLSSTSFKNLQSGAVNLGFSRFLNLPRFLSLPFLSSPQFLNFPRFLRRLSLGWCNLVDGDISSGFWGELSNLQVLDLSGNKFSQLHSSLPQLPCLKFVNLSDCYNLVELPDLPPSIAILIANGCKSLKIVGAFPKNHLKWLWKVSFSASNCNCKEVLQSMLQGNATEDYFISFRCYGTCIPVSGGKLGTFMLQLPLNWYNEFSGFLVYIDWDTDDGDVIIINDVLGGENEDVDNEETEDVDNEETEDVDDEETMRADAMCYISFGSLRDTSWWNSAHTTISFSLRVDVYLKVELVPRGSQGDASIGRAKDTTYYSEFWDEESPNKKTFEIICDSGSSIEILFCHNLYSGMFDGI